MRKDDVSIFDPTIMSVSAPRNSGRNDRDEGAVSKLREEDGDMHLQIIVGSVREGRTSLGVGDWALAHIQHRNELTVELIDLKKWNLPMMDFAAPPAMGVYENDLQKRWGEKVAQADGYIFVSPEYNHGYSAALKNALDYVYAEWHRKPATFISFGNALGARGIEQLRLVLIELQMAPLSAALHIADMREKHQDGTFRGDGKDTERFDAVLDDLIWWTAALRAARARCCDVAKAQS